MDSESASFSVAHFDFESLPPLTSPWRRLGATAVGLGLIRLPAGQGYTFTHSHARQEELYVVVEGAGRILLDGKELPLSRGDVVRVAPTVRRALRAADDASLFVVCAGAVPVGYPENACSRYLIDDGVPHYEDVPPWYAGDPAVAARNAELRARMERSAQKRAGPRSDDSPPGP